MTTVKDHLEGINYTLKENGSETTIFKLSLVWKYSILYLIQKGVLDFSDPVEKWKAYVERYPPADHIKTANAFLKRQGATPLNYRDDMFRNSA